MVEIGVRHLHIILLKVREFREIRRRLGRILSVGVDDMTFSRASSAVRYVEGNECLAVVYCVAKYTIRIPLASSQHNLMTYTYCCVYSTRLLMMDRKAVRYM